MPNIAVIGRTSQLAKCLYNGLIPQHRVTVFGRPELDFKKPDSVRDLARSLCEFDCIINCAGSCVGTAEEIYAVNAVGPIVLIKELQQLESTARVIMVGSHGAMWPSWPGADQSRIVYNCAKRALQDFVVSFSHARCSNMQLCVFNASRFQSAMSGYTGYETTTVAQQILDVIQWTPLPVKIEMESPDACPSA